MNDYLVALALACMPALGNFAGGVLAELLPFSRRGLNLALHLATGIVMAVVAVELIPRTLAAAQPWMMILAFVGGGLFFLAVDAILDVAASRTGEGTAKSAWVIFFGVCVDLFSDGIMIGTGSTLSLGLGLLLALGQVPADVPEGFATIATFKSKGLSRRTRLLLSACFALPILLGTTIGYWAVRGKPEAVKLGLLAFVAGILLTVTVEELIPESHAIKDNRWATICLIAGFAVFALLSKYLA